MQCSLLKPLFPAHQLVFSPSRIKIWGFGHFSADCSPGIAGLIQGHSTREKDHDAGGHAQ